MTEAELLKEEITELVGQINRLKGSMNRQDNGVKIARLAVLSRTLGRCQKSLDKAVKNEAQQ